MREPFFLFSIQDFCRREFWIGRTRQILGLKKSYGNDKNPANNTRKSDYNNIYNKIPVLRNWTYLAQMFRWKESTVQIITQNGQPKKNNLRRPEL